MKKRKLQWAEGGTKRKPIKAYSEADRLRLALKKKADKRKFDKEN
jgi:hypothetical protein